MKKRKIKPSDLPSFRGRRFPRSRSPQMLGEKSISGHMADLESDDDVLVAAHEMGIGLSEDYEHPKELNIAADIDKAERYHRTH